MRGESWATHIGLGLVITGLGAWGTWALVQEHRIEDRPVRIAEVADALAPQTGPERLVTLTDLVVDCERLVAVEGHVYAPGQGDDWRQRVVVEVSPGETCAEVAGRAHRVDPAPADVSAKVFAPFGVEPRDDFVRVRGFDMGWSYALAALAVVVVGLLWMLGALRMRRVYAAGLAEALARAAAPNKAPEADPESAQGGPYRAEGEERRLLPRPLRLRAQSLAEQRRRGFILGSAGWLVLALSLAYLGDAGWTLHLEQERWTQGVTADEISVSGQVKEHRSGILYSAEFDYAYYDAHRRPHVGERTFTSLTGDFRAAGFEVRYLPDEPQLHAIAPLGGATGGIWAWTLLLGGVGIGLSVALLLAARRALATPRRWLTVLEDPQEVELVVTSAVDVVNRGASTGVTQYTFDVPGSDRPFTYRCPDPTRAPFFFDLDRTRALGLRNPKHPDAVMVLRSDLTPLDVELGLEGQIRARTRDTVGR